jgi:transcriptional regulator with XRE-family HTH domain
MELGQLLKQVRLEAGLSQRQLCGDAITRNMLSQIENGTAKPSMQTLQYLAGKLGKPVGYFLQEDVPSPNQQLLLSARQAFESGDPAYATAILSEYRCPDPVFDPEFHLLQALLSLQLAKRALEEDRIPYCLHLLEHAAQHSEKTPYCRQELEQRRLLLLANADASHCHHALQYFSEDEKWLLIARAAFHNGSFSACAELLDLFPHPQDLQWSLLRGDAAFAAGDYSKAISFYLPFEDHALSRLEQCHHQLEDYKMAYHYACKQRK